ncbi:uncharacterized protein LOC124440003 isoform X3 [Xenia sp. Carnegie-2017]|nr:uncharacterized protein LOC124440003 isoform X3 [Xenia sp. Carnegie-2017]XP_046846275.1 uncharacterized protein LOC124440003 isoform X3 [Xenia sp. Carnegie-2017]
MKDIGRTQLDETQDSEDLFQTEKWTWKPVGADWNGVENAHAWQYFGNVSKSDEEESYNEHEVETEVDPFTNMTFIFSPSSPGIIFGKRNKTVEKAHLVFEGQLKTTNWCFKAYYTKASKKYKKTMNCCKKLRKCQKKRHVKDGIFDCSCAIYFNICLKKAKTNMAKTIEKMYFDRNIVCYKKNHNCGADGKCVTNFAYQWKIIYRYLG